jgi:AcrR family transcriptional regulator
VHTAGVGGRGGASTGGRQRILEAAYDCIARRGLARTTVEDAARQAGVARATVYRHFPGGREELVREAIGWETGRFFRRLAETVVDTEDFAEVLAQALGEAQRMVEGHAVLQALLRSEPERLLPALTEEARGILPLIAEFLRPYLVRERLRDGVGVDEAAAYLARMILSLMNAPGRWDLTDRAAVADLVRVELLGGVTEVTPPTP